MLKKDNDAELLHEFEKLAVPLMKFLAYNYHPHVSVVLTATTAELSSVIACVKNDDLPN